MAIFERAALNDICAREASDLFLNNEAALRAHLKGALCACYYLYGENDYLVRQYAKEFVKRASGGSDSELVVQRFDFQTADMDEVYDAALSVSFFGTGKCLYFPAFKPSELPASEIAKLIALLPMLPEGVTLVFAAREAPPKAGKHSLFNELEQYGVVVELSAREQNELVKFCQKAASRAGAEIKSTTCADLIAYTSDNMQSLSTELAKLSAYVGEGHEILPEHIRLLCAQSLDQSVFDIVKALLRRDLAAALARLDTLRQRHESPISALGAIEANFIDLYRAKLADVRRIPSSQVAADFGYRGPSDFRLSRASTDAKKLTPGYLRTCLEILAQTDQDCKQLRTDPYELLEQTIVRLLDARQNAR